MIALGLQNNAGNIRNSISALLPWNSELRKKKKKAFKGRVREFTDTLHAESPTLF